MPPETRAGGDEATSEGAPIDPSTIATAVGMCTSTTSATVGRGNPLAVLADGAWDGTLRMDSDASEWEELQKSMGLSWLQRETLRR